MATVQAASRTKSSDGKVRTETKPQQVVRVDRATLSTLSKNGITLCEIPGGPVKLVRSQSLELLDEGAKKKNWMAKKLSGVKAGLKSMLQQSSKTMKGVSLEALFKQLSNDVCPSLQFALLKVGQAIQSLGNTTQIFHGKYSNTPVSVKILDQKECNASSILAAEVIGEMRYLSCSAHPNIMEVVGVSWNKSAGRMVFAYGSVQCSLLQYVSSKQVAEGWQVPCSQAVSWAVGLAEAVNFLHTSRIPLVHCGIRPAGIFLDENLKVKLGDFSYCRYPGETVMLDEFRPDQESDPYAAPELRRNNSTCTLKSDVYSVAMVIYYICRGKDPYTQVFLKPNIQILRKHYPSGMVRCISSGWAPKPKQRPSAHKLLTMLKGIQTVRRLPTIPEDCELELASIETKVEPVARSQSFR
mmetsp:Transcript_3129/g.6273  ORF Transcript_3129/g.6273 Transcript_3129/m.6273 type:complete len:412 (-) Transcript_3129:60-1295(-)|eukprot:CAMPEP_0181325732 /NCGR_PEP_ID=MMETSP1101-20121128/21097_1 /TAXON_ID=46948 /ORGANISM="Rhodomonas abbreviata, Strain Caron Lab Isolate" /LENGTH=411 /DNA_ID=CAMNT_0023434089 /DNA_START=82 /DNA_END=1317 /DNA_ORIENTATION=+